MLVDKLGVALVASLGIVAFASEASAFCRTTTCDPRQGQSCRKDADGCVIDGIPLAWPSRCIGFSLQKDALPGQISLDQFTTIAYRSFAAWQDVKCPGSEEQPSIRFFDLGPVACDRHEYNQNQGNANVLMFRTGSWPYGHSGNTLALTTVTYNVDTGEIYDADIEINGTMPLSIGSPVQYDLQSILTHEIGHFLGFAHSKDPESTMFDKYQAGGTSLRTLDEDDISAVCSVYPPDRQTPACDPTPRHGFASECAVETSQAGCCTTAPGHAPSGGQALGLVGIGLATIYARRHRLRSRGA